jgi:hypothetical protein
MPRRRGQRCLALLVSQLLDVEAECLVADTGSRWRASPRPCSERATRVVAITGNNGKTTVKTLLAISPEWARSMPTRATATTRSACRWR